MTPHLSTHPDHKSIWGLDESDHNNFSLDRNNSKEIFLKGRKLEKIKLRKFRTISIDGIEVLPRINWRNLHAITKVKDQKKCNACYAFAGIAAVEANHRIHKGKMFNLSEQEIVDCSRENEGCVGGLPTLVYEYIRANDISLSSTYPYDQSKSKNCRKRGPKYNGLNLTSYTNLGKGILNLIKALSLGPVAVISYASFAFKHFGGGVYRGQGCYGKKQPNHASLLVGYNLIGSSKYFYFKNGWGSDWGDDGYYKVKIGNLNNANQGLCLIAATTYNSIPMFF